MARPPKTDAQLAVEEQRAAKAADRRDALQSALNQGGAAFDRRAGGAKKTHKRAQNQSVTAAPKVAKAKKTKQSGPSSDDEFRPARTRGTGAQSTRSSTRFANNPPQTPPSSSKKRGPSAIAPSAPRQSAKRPKARASTSALPANDGDWPPALLDLDITPIPIVRKRQTAPPKQSRRKKPKLHHTLGKLPSGREIYNTENAGFPPGEIQHGRAKKAGRHIEFRVHYTPDPETGKIFFNAPDEKWGGPFGFLSNMFESKMNAPDIAPLYTFSCVEHALQFVKAAIMSLSEERFSHAFDREVGSKEMVDIILSDRLSPGELVVYGSKFDEVGGWDPVWWGEWHDLWTAGMRVLLKRAVFAKFNSSLPLKTLLMMTGDYGLYKASGDRVLGIGYHAHTAIRYEHKYGQNMLGEVLMEVRSEIRAQEPWWPTEYAFEYFRAKEMGHAAKQASGAESVDSGGSTATEAKDAWLALGGVDLKSGMEKLVIKDCHLRKSRFELDRQLASLQLENAKADAKV